MAQGTTEVNKKYYWLDKNIRRLPEYKIWRESVYKRDDYTCLKCSKKGCELNADHIIPFNFILKEFKITSNEEAVKCNLLWDIENGRTLCLLCHKVFGWRKGKDINFNLN